MRSLLNLLENESAVIRQVAKSDISNKLLEMGILPGAEVQMCCKAPFGGPICVKICGYCVSLRLKEADLILLED